MPKPQVACQLIVFRERLPAEMESVLKDVKDAGYAGVEYGLAEDPAVLKRFEAALKEQGLALSGSHMSYYKLDQFEAHLAYLKRHGSKLLMISTTGDRKDGAASYRRAAKELNARGRQAADAGVRFCYHNHSWEFKEVFDGVSGMDILIQETDPRYVHFCFDTYWLADGGVDVVEYLRTYRERIGCLHLKDRKAGTFTEVGAGEIDWPGVFRAIEPLNLPWVVTEKDRTETDPVLSARQSRAYLQTAVGV